MIDLTCSRLFKRATYVWKVYFWMENLILDDVNLFVVKGIKYRAMSSGIISGKPMHIIESVGSRVSWKN